MSMHTLQLDLACQRYLDREMVQSEEDALLAQLSESEKSELLATRNALSALESMPRMPVPVDLSRNVMAALTPKRQSVFARARQWLERRPMLGWEFGGAALAASVLFVMLSPLSMVPSQNGFAQAPSLLTPAMHTTRPSGSTIQLSLYAPQAQSVALIGEFNGWGSTTEIKLSPSGNGMWSVALPLPAGRYQYAFLVDGHRWVTDPRAEQHLNDDFGRRNAVVTII